MIKDAATEVAMGKNRVPSDSGTGDNEAADYTSYGGRGNSPGGTRIGDAESVLAGSRSVRAGTDRQKIPECQITGLMTEIIARILSVSEVRDTGADFASEGGYQERDQQRGGCPGPDSDLRVSVRGSHIYRRPTAAQVARKPRVARESSGDDMSAGGYINGS